MLLGYKLQPNHPQKEHLRARHPRKWFCSSWAAFCWRCCAFHRVRCCKPFPSNLSSKWKVAGHLLTPGCSNLLRSAVALHLDIAKKVQMLAYTRIKCPGLKVGSWFQISATFAMQCIKCFKKLHQCAHAKGKKGYRSMWCKRHGYKHENLHTLLCPPPPPRLAIAYFAGASKPPRRLPGEREGTHKLYLPSCLLASERKRKVFSLWVFNENT